MTIKEFKAIASLLKKAYREIEDEAIKNGYSLVSDEYEALIANVRLAILEEAGFTLDEYLKHKGKKEDEMAKTKNELKNVKKEVEAEQIARKDLKIPTEKEIEAIAERVAKKHVKPPKVKIVNKVVEKAIRPKVVKETVKVTERVEYNDKPLQEHLGALSKRLDEVKIPDPIDIDLLKKDWQSDFGEMFEYNIDTLGMPDFRKLAMGLQDQIDKIDVEASEIKIGEPVLNGTANRILYEDASNNLAESANLTFDGTDIVVGGTGTFGGSSSGQSIITSGLVVNEGGTGNATDDFRAETLNFSNAFVVDASADVVNFGVNVGIGGAPSYDLDVTGDINFTGTLYQDGVEYSVSFGTDNQIPYTNAAGDDFDYSSSFTFDGSSFIVAANTFLSGNDISSVGTLGASIIRTADGTEAAPSVTASGQTNTGLFFPSGVPEIAWSVNGTEAMRLHTNGLNLVGEFKSTGTGNIVLTGSIDPAASTTVTGVGTLFLTELEVGDRILVTGETRTVTAIATNLSLTVDTAFTDNANDTSPERLPAAVIVADNSDVVNLMMDSVGKVGVGTVTPDSLLEVSGDSNLDGTVKVGATSGKTIMGDVTGNARGTNAVDIQSSRGADTQVASGAISTAVGYQNTALGLYSSVVGALNTASGAQSSVFGNQNTASVVASAFGSINTASGTASSAVGGGNTASGTTSSSVGYGNTASTDNSAALGTNNTAGTGTNNTAVGIGNTASGDYFDVGQSSAFGYYNTASGHRSTASGYRTDATGYGSSASGYSNCACELYSVAVGTSNLASGPYSSAFGKGNTASGDYSSASGYENTASGDYSTASGYYNTASGCYSSASGYLNTASGNYNSAFGTCNTASSSTSSAFGHLNTASNTAASAFGMGNTASGSASSAFGRANTASGANSTVSGYKNTSSALNSQMFGRQNFSSTGGLAGVGLGVLNNSSGGTLNKTTGAITGTITAATTVGKVSVAVGVENFTEGDTSTAVGVLNSITQDYSSAFGYNNTASGLASVALGYQNTASCSSGAAVGSVNTASESGSSAFGFTNTASGANSTASGYQNTASATDSSAFGSNITNNTATSTMIGPSDAAKVTILSTGNVGIGTDAPGAKLDVRGAAVFNEAGADVDFRVEGVGEANALFVQGSDGNVGIGTSSPSDLLHVYGDTTSQTYLNIENPNAGTSAGLGFELNNDEGRALTTLYSSNHTTAPNGLYFKNEVGPTHFVASDHIGFGIGSAYADAADLYINSSGNVGIGTTAPGEMLHIKDSVAPVIKLENTDTSLGDQQEVGAIEFYSNDSSQSGAVGRLKSFSDNASGSIYAMALEILGTNKFVFRQTGILGISNDLSGVSPTSLLHVEATTAKPQDGYPVAYIGNQDTFPTTNGDTMRIKGGANSADSYIFDAQDASGNTDFYIGGDGLVGVGTDTPDERFSVEDTFLVATGGDTYWAGEGSGLAFGQIYEEDGSTTMALAAQDTFYQIVVFTADGESNLTTPDYTNDHITVTKAGRYLAFLDVSFSQTTAVSIEYDFHVKKNNGATDFPCVSAHRDTAGASTVGATNGTGIIDLDAGDTVEVWVERLTGGAVSRTITIPQISLTLTMVGGT